MAQGRSSGGTSDKGQGRPGPSVRLLRVGEQIRHLLAEAVRRDEVGDRTLARHLITIAEVRVSADLRHATAFVAPLGGGDPAAALTALRRNSKALKHWVGRGLSMKYTPELVFRADETFDVAAKVGALLAAPHVRQDLTASRRLKADDEDEGEG